jgi:hypothetical protein
MDKTKKKQIFLVLGVMIILAQVIQLLQPDMGIPTGNSDEAAGYMFGYVLILIIGIVLTYKGLKKDKSKPKK